MIKFYCIFLQSALGAEHSTINGV